MESCTDDKVLFIEAPSLEFLHKKPEWSFKNNVLRRIGLHDLRHVFTLFLILGITMYITYRFELSRMKKGVKLESENEPHNIISRAKLESENEPRITGAKFESENKPRTDAANVTVVDNKIEQQNNIDDSANSESEDESRTGAKFESENGPRTVIKDSRFKPGLRSYSAEKKEYPSSEEDPPFNLGRAESYRIDNANHADGINGNNGYNQSEGVEYNKQSEGVNDNKQSDNDAEGGNNNKQSDMKKKHQQDKPFVRQGITSQPEKPVPRPIENDNDDESIKDQPQKPSPRILASSDDTQSQETPENKKGKYKKVKDNDSSDERWKHGSKPTG
eukprot:138032_1